jgi:hypothetical protein
MQSLLSIFTGNWSGFQNFSHFPLHFPSHPHSIIVMPCTTRRGGTNQISQKSWIKRSRGVKVNLKSKQHDRVAVVPMLQHQVVPCIEGRGTKKTEFYTLWSVGFTVTIWQEPLCNPKSLKQQKTEYSGTFISSTLWPYLHPLLTEL